MIKPYTLGEFAERLASRSDAQKAADTARLRAVADAVVGSFKLEPNQPKRKAFSPRANQTPLF